MFEPMKLVFKNTHDEASTAMIAAKSLDIRNVSLININLSAGSMLLIAIGFYRLSFSNVCVANGYSRL